MNTKNPTVLVHVSLTQSMIISCTSMLMKNNFSAMDDVFQTKINGHISSVTPVVGYSVSI